MDADSQRSAAEMEMTEEEARDNATLSTVGLVRLDV